MATTEQPRQAATARFGSHYTRERLRWLLRVVANAIRTAQPERITQAEFDERAPSLMTELGEPPPPSARAIYMRLNKGARRKRKSWRELVTDVCAENVSDARAEAIARRETENPFIDERHVWYALRRVAQHLGRTPTPDQYDAARRELLDEAARLGRSDVLEDVLPTSGQILVLADHLGWEGACALASLTPPTPKAQLTGLDPVRLAEHFYETKKQLPSARALRQYAAELGISLPQKVTAASFTAELKRRRAERGLDTPETGPASGSELPAAELAALIADAPAKRPKDYWTLDRVLDALAEYVSEFENTVPLRQKHYLTARAKRAWPPLDAINRQANAAEIAGFQGMITAARKRVAAAAQEAA